MTKLAGEQADTACPKIMSAMHASGHPHEVINRLAEHARPWDLMNAAESRAYTAQQLEHAYADFKLSVKPSLTEQFAYDPASYNVWHMVTAAFAHASLGPYRWQFDFLLCIRRDSGDGDRLIGICRDDLRLGYRRRCRSAMRVFGLTFRTPPVPTFRSPICPNALYRDRSTSV